MSSQATSLTDFCLEFMPAQGVKHLSDMAQKDITALIAGLVPRLMIVSAERPHLLLEDLTVLYVMRYLPSDRVHGIACFKLEPPKEEGDKTVLKFFGISLLNDNGYDLDGASEFGIRDRLLKSCRAYLEDYSSAEVRNLSTIQF